MGHSFNSDEIQREDATYTHPFAAGRELLRRVAVLEASGATFAIETTLSSTMYAEKLRTWSRRGYRTTLHFIELPSADYAVERVARRVASGGHSVPEADIRRRYQRGLQLFQAVFQASAGPVVSLAERRWRSAACRPRAEVKRTNENWKSYLRLPAEQRGMPCMVQRT